MKKLISCLLAVVMLCTVASAFAADAAPVQKSNVLSKFLDETDLQKKDLALQVQSGNQTTDLVIRLDGDNLHLVTRNGDAVEGHIQLNPTGIYVAGDSNVTLLRYSTVTTLLQDVIKAVDSALKEAIDSIPEQQIVTESEMKELVNQAAVLAAEAAVQEEADSVTLTSAAMAFADKFKPEYILDVKEEYGTVVITLRSEAFATALGEAMDELMTNPALAEFVDRKAALKDGKTFAEAQLEWAANREATLDTISTIQNTNTIDENGHLTSHFQIGREGTSVKVLVCDTDSWIDVENNEVEFNVRLGFQNEDPFMVYDFAVNQYNYWEKLTAGDSCVEINGEFNEGRLRSCKVVTVLEGKEEMKMEFGSDYLYIKGPKGGLSTSVRETWTGKARFELVAENAKGEESTVIVDFYQDEDSLISELYSDKADQTVLFKISRIEKANFDDLTAAQNINELTVDGIYTELGNLLKNAIPALNNTTEAGK